MTAIELDLPTPEWALPLLDVGGKPYLGAKGGRSSGKSHFLAELLVERMTCEPDLQWVCIREVQKSLRLSAKKLIEEKIRTLGVAHLFRILDNEIRRRDGLGLVVFQGMQDHTADSIKSLEGFDGAWVEEAQSLSARSIELLVPTIRKDGSEIWFSWNPDQPTDPVDEFLIGNPDAVVVHCTYLDNPFLPERARKQAETARKRNPDTFGHIWLGEYASISKSQIFAGKTSVEEFTPNPNLWHGPYYGLDFGFSADPTAAVTCWVWDNVLYIEHEGGDVGLELDDTTDFLAERLPGIEQGTIRADNARPESISYLERHGLPGIIPCEKWPGSVEDGITHIKSYERVVIHPRCEQMQLEARQYRYKVDRWTGDVTRQIVDKHNHYWDAVRYAIGPMIRSQDIDYSELV